MGIIGGLLLLVYAFVVWWKMRGLRLESDRRFREGGDAALHAVEQEALAEYQVGLRGSSHEHWRQVLKMLIATLTRSLVAWTAIRFGQPGSGLTIVAGIGGGIGACLFACFTVLSTAIAFFHTLASKFR